MKYHLLLLPLFILLAVLSTGDETFAQASLAGIPDAIPWELQPPIPIVESGNQSDCSINKPSGILDKPAVKTKEWCDRKCKWSIAVYVAGSSMDVASSWGQRELNPLANDDKGNFVPWKGIALKGGHLGLTLAFQKKYPRAMFWSRIVVGAFYAGIAIRNWSIPNRR